MDKETERFLVDAVEELDQTMVATHQMMYLATSDPEMKEAILGMQEQIWKARRMVAAKWREG